MLVVLLYLQVALGNIQIMAISQLMIYIKGTEEMKIAFGWLPLCVMHSHKHSHFDVHAQKKLFYAKAGDMTTLVIVLPKEPNVSLRHQRDVED